MARGAPANAAAAAALATATRACCRVGSRARRKAPRARPCGGVRRVPPVRPPPGGRLGAPRRGAGRAAFGPPFWARCAPRRAPCGSLPLSCLRGFGPRPPACITFSRFRQGARPLTRRLLPPLTERPNVITPRQAPMSQMCAIGTTFQQSSIMPLITCKFAATDRTCNRSFAILSSILRRLVPFGSASSTHRSYNNPISCAVNITIYFTLTS